MRPTRITNPGAVPRYALGAPADGGEGEEPPVDCCEVDPDNLPNRAADRTPLSLFEPGALSIVQQSEYESADTELDATSHAALDDAPTPGNVMVGMFWLRDPVAGTWPSGWTVIESLVTTSGIGQGSLEMRYRVVQPGDDGTLYIHKGGSRYGYTVMVELSGAGAPNDSAEADLQTGPASMSVGPATVSADDSLAIAALMAIGINETITPGGTWTTIETGQAGASPTGLAEYKVVDTGTVTATGSSGSGIDSWAGILAVFDPQTDPTWLVLNPRVTDGDDATYNDVDASAGEHLRFDLGSAFRIVRTRIRLGTTTSGAKTLTLYGANEPDFSDVVEITDIAFTATGSLTAQNVTDTFAENTTAYRYYQLDGPSEVVRWYEVEFYEPTLSQSHEHSSIAEEAVRDAGRWELAVVPGSPPDSLYADGDWLYIWVPGA